MKKRLFLLTVFTLSLFCSFAQVKWTTIEKASTIHNDKLYMVDFYTSWCGWCKKMDNETFSNPIVVKILNKYYNPVKFNAEGNAADSLRISLSKSLVIILLYKIWTKLEYDSIFAAKYKIFNIAEWGC